MPKIQVWREEHDRVNIKNELSFCDVGTDVKGSSCLPYHTATFIIFKRQWILRIEDDKKEG